MKCSPADIINPSPLRDVVRYRDGDTQDIITVILRMDRDADGFINHDAAECLRGKNDYETLRNVWRFVRGNVRYVVDRSGKEVVKSPGALFKIGKGDCKSFSISEAALLRSLGFRGIRYRFASYGSDHTPTHVYIVCRLNGQDVILDAVHTAFDDEVRYTWKKDVRAVTASGVSGLPDPAPKKNIFKLVAMGILAWAVFK